MKTAGLSYRWVAMGVVVVGTFMVVLDTTIVNLALSTLAHDFDSDLSVEWIVTGYLAAVGVSQMTTGWVGDRFGRKRVFITSLVLFTFGSLLCAAAPSLELLVAARVVQGVGGGLLIPIAMAMIYELFAPHERGRAMGIFGIAVMAAPAIGPVLGGSVVSSFGWRWLFLINVPVGLVGVPLAIKLLRETGYHEERPFDGKGLLLAVAVAGLSVPLGLALFLWNEVQALPTGAESAFYGSFVLDRFALFFQFL
ncbi:MAG: MFS transporter, partial [Acidobacteria bacterium]|nr:MFS transporter [Acidobacteriota bacterium]